MKKSLFAIICAGFLVTACETAPTGAEGAGSGSGFNTDSGAGFSSSGASDSGELASDVSDRIFFAYDSSTLDAEAQDALRRQYGWLQQNSNVSITLEGHCDERGTREYNIALGERRANAAKRYLVSLGMSPARINTVSYGKERPAVVGSDPSAWAQNRRAVTVISNY